MVNSILFLKFGAAVFIGILAGLQREFALEEQHREVIAGVRTFAILALIGCSSALLGDLAHSPLPLIGALLAVGALLVVNHHADVQQGRQGLTTKMASIATVLTGALCYWNVSLAVALGVATTVLLSMKPVTHRFVTRLTKADLIATLKFAVITAIVLPVLPNQTYGPVPFNIFNPFKIWVIIVFISAISFVGYVLIKAVGAKRGIGITGLLGGMVSSTAVTLSFTQRSRSAAGLSHNFALAIVIAWMVMYARVFTIVAVLNFPLSKHLLIPILVAIVIALGWSLYLWLANKSSGDKHEISFSNPFELVPAIGFGLLFVVVLFICKVAQVYFGNAGIFVSSLVSGFADVDAITLSMARMARDVSAVTPKVAVEAIIIATSANTLLKGFIAVTGGSAGLRKAIIPATLLIAGGSLIAVFFI